MDARSKSAHGQTSALEPCLLIQVFLRFDGVPTASAELSATSRLRKDWTLSAGRKNFNQKSRLPDPRTEEILVPCRSTRERTRLPSAQSANVVKKTELSCVEADSRGRRLRYERRDDDQDADGDNDSHADD